MVACSFGTSAEGIADVAGVADAGADAVGTDYEVSSCPHLVACLALPADDGRSSCRLGREILLPTRPRSGRIGVARAKVEPRGSWQWEMFATGVSARKADEATRIEA